MISVQRMHRDSAERKRNCYSAPSCFYQRRSYAVKVLHYLGIGRLPKRPMVDATGGTGYELLVVAAVLGRSLQNAALAASIFPVSHFVRLSVRRSSRVIERNYLEARRRILERKILARNHRLGLRVS